MTTSKEKRVPALRFPEFDGDWRKMLLGELIESHVERVSADTNIPVYSSSRTGLKPQKDYFDGRNLINEGDYGVVPEGYFVYRHMSDDSTFKFNINTLESKIAVSKEYPVFRTHNLNSYFLLHKLNEGNDFKRFCIEQKKGGTRTRLYFKVLCSWKTLFPSLPEQTKIADFLTTVDTKIQQLTRKKELLTQYKTGAMQKLFSQAIRFKDEAGQSYPDWEEKKFKEIFKRVRTKNEENNQNVLTISAQYGLINQKEYFNKSVSAKDVTGYYLLEKNDFAYNKSYSQGYPMGAIKRLTRYAKGVVSTLYICFRTKNPQDAYFFEHYFNSGFLNKELHKIAQEGARNHGLLNMSIDDFFNLPVPYPSLPEQTKIANFISTIDIKIDQVDTELNQLKTWKKGLLQQLFI